MNHPGPLPEDYVRAVRAMLDVCKPWAAEHPGPAPRFRLPPLDVAFLAPLHAAAHAVAPTARERSLLDAMITAAEPHGGSTLTRREVGGISVVLSPGGSS